MGPLQLEIRLAQRPRGGMVPFRGGLAAQMDHIGIVLGLDVAEHEGVSLSYDMQVKTWQIRWRKQTGGGQG